MVEFFLLCLFNLISHLHLISKINVGGNLIQSEGGRTLGLDRAGHP